MSEKLNNETILKAFLWIFQKELTIAKPGLATSTAAFDGGHGETKQLCVRFEDKKRHLIINEYSEWFLRPAAVKLIDQMLPISKNWLLFKRIPLLDGMTDCRTAELSGISARIMNFWQWADPCIMETQIDIEYNVVKAMSETKNN